MKKDFLPIISIDPSNIEKEDLCCAKSMDKKNSEGVILKKKWMLERFEEGMIFKKIQSSAKIFIEYIPAEYAWRPITADGYMCIHCLWVSGSAQGKGFGHALLAECEKDSKNMNGVTVVTSKKPFLTDKKIFLKHGFEVCDSAEPYFELLVKKYNKKAEDPKFNSPAKSGVIKKSKGLMVAYSRQCPFSNYYIHEMEKAALQVKIPFRAQIIESCEDAQNLASPYGTFGVFYDGKFISHEIMSIGRFEKLLAGIKLK